MFCLLHWAVNGASGTLLQELGNSVHYTSVLNVKEKHLKAQSFDVQCIQSTNTSQQIGNDMYEQFSSLDINVTVTNSEYIISVPLM